MAQDFDSSLAEEVVMQARVHFHRIAAVIGTVLLIFSGAARAQISIQDQKCANSINKGAAKVAKAQAGANAACIKDYAKNKIPSAEACLTSDPKGKVAKAISKIKTSDCTGGAPSFLPGLATSSSEIGDIMKQKDLDLIHDLFGSDLDVSIVDAGVDKAGSKCQAAVAKAAAKCQDAKLSSFNSCKKDELKAGDTDIEGCLGSGTGGIPDLKGKIAKKCGNGLGGTIGKKCGVPNTEDLFPPCAGQDLGDCLDQKIECEVCLALNALDGLSRNCDLFDDGTINLSCPLCTTGSIVGIGMAFDDTDANGPATILELYDDTNSGIIDPNDVIVVYRGIPVSNGVELADAIQTLPDVGVGDPVPMTIKKAGGAEQDVAPVAKAVCTSGQSDPVTFKGHICEERELPSNKKTCLCVLALSIEQTCTSFATFELKDDKFVKVVFHCSDNVGGMCDGENLVGK